MFSLLRSTSRFSHSLRQFTPSRSVVTQVVAEDELQNAIANGVSNNKLVVIDWFANWCGPCQRMKPHFLQLSEDPTIKDKAIFLTVDCDSLSDASVAAGVSSLPTFHLIKGDKMVDSLIGADPNKLKQMVLKHVSN
jgi:thiol-disulfide isomerase/thioredoxin